MDSVLVVRAIHRNGTYERRGSGGAGWQVSHERVLSFARRRAGLEWEEGRLLREALRAGVHRRLGTAQNRRCAAKRQSDMVGCA